MCSLLYKKRLSNSPYVDLLDQNLSNDIQHAFTRDFCQLLGLSADSPLYISVTVGVSALPTILKMSSILKDKSGLAWNQSGELPVEIPLQDSYRFHSVFACPVSKELGTDENPPMMMPCGHVICKESLNRLGKGSSTSRFKCPYCPQESSASQAISVYF
jgi:E3 ubiquitin-protein transferase RMND5